MYNSTMVVHILSYEDRVVSGEFVNLAYRKKYYFQGMDQMLLMMEDVMDAVASPQAVYQHRSLQGQPYVLAETDSSYCLDALDKGSYLQLPQIATSFLIRCTYRQHGSMQGELVIPGGGQQKVSYRSALELMRLIYEYLDREQETNKPWMAIAK